MIRQALRRAALVRAVQPRHVSARGLTVSSARFRQHHREFDEDGPIAREMKATTKLEQREADAAEAAAAEQELYEAQEEEVYDEEWVVPEGQLGGENGEDVVYESLEKLSNSGKVDDPIIPSRPLMYELPYSIEGYRNSQRIWEGIGDESEGSASNNLFTDMKILKLGSGKGGDGKVSFFRDAGRSKGPPDGGDGGEGGAVYIQAVPGETSLHKLRYHYRSEDGRPGSMTSLNGRAGKDTLLQVPVGTVVKWIPDPKVSYETYKAERALAEDQGEAANTKKKQPALRVKVDCLINQYDRRVPLGIKLPRAVYADGEGWIFRDKDEAYQHEREYFLQLRDRVALHDHKLRGQEEAEDYFPIEGIDLSKPGPPLLLLRGGRGGLGNTHFHTQMIRNPRFAKRGRAGLTSFFLLELKMLADLGLVGLPNAGKSTLLRAISKARPRVGHWAFTTLRPTVGTISLGLARPAFTVADIPGIVKGAREENKGMGLDFLRHVERSGGLVFVISLEGKDGAGTGEAGAEEPSKDAEEPREETGDAAAAKPPHTVVDDLDLLVNELGPTRMRGKRVLVVGTKADLPGSEHQFRLLSRVCKERGWACVPCCAERRENVESVIEMMGRAAGKA